jgi:hypothetical protein
MERGRTHVSSASTRHWVVSQGSLEADGGGRWAEGSGQWAMGKV